MSKFEQSKETFWKHKGEKRTAKMEMLDTPFDDTPQGTYYENGETVNEFEQDRYTPFGTVKKGKKPETEITAGGNS